METDESENQIKPLNPLQEKLTILLTSLSAPPPSWAAFRRFEKAPAKPRVASRRFLPSSSSSSKPAIILIPFDKSCKLDELKKKVKSQLDAYLRSLGL